MPCGKIRLALRGHRVHPLLMPADFEDIAAACGLAVREVELSADHFRFLDAMAERTGKPYCQILSEGVALLMERMGEAVPKVELPRR